MPTARLPQFLRYRALGFWVRVPHAQDERIRQGIVVERGDDIGEPFLPLQFLERLLSGYEPHLVDTGVRLEARSKSFGIGLARARLQVNGNLGFERYARCQRAQALQ